MTELDHPLYITIPYGIFADPELSPIDKLILAEIASLLRVETLFCWATNDHFEALFGVSTDTVTRAIDRLKERKYIGALVLKDGCSETKCPFNQRGWHRHIVPTGLLVTLSAKSGGAIRKKRRGYPQNTATISTRTRNNEKRALRFEELKATKNKTDLEVREYLHLANLMG